MNDLKIFKNNDFGGYVYIINFGDCIKIGSSINPRNRIRQVSSYLSSYAGFNKYSSCISRKHLNYRENEMFLHGKFDDFRINNTELFKVSYSEAVSALKELNYETDFDKYALEKEESFENLKDTFNDIVEFKTESTLKDLFQEDNLKTAISEYEKILRILKVTYEYIYSNLDFEESYIAELSDDVRDKYLKNRGRCHD